MPAPNSKASDIIMIVTRVCTNSIVTFFSSRFPKYAPTNADRTAARRIGAFSPMTTFEYFEKYTDNLETSTTEAIMTPVAIKLSFERPHLMRKALRKAP